MADYKPGLQIPLYFQNEDNSLYDNSEASASISPNIRPSYFPNKNKHYLTNTQTISPGNSSSIYDQTYYVKNDDATNSDNTMNNYEASKKSICRELTLGIILLICAVVGIIMQFVGGYVNALALGDDIAVLLISLVLILFAFRKKVIKSCLFGIFVGIVWFVGFGCKSFGIQFVVKDDDNYIVLVPLLYFLLLLIRTFGLFIFMPLFCADK